MKKVDALALAVSLVAVIGASLVLAFVLSLGTSAGSASGISLAVLGQRVVAALLLLAIGLAAVRLAARLRSRKFGSRLLAKLAGIFAVVGVVPGC